MNKTRLFLSALLGMGMLMLAAPTAATAASPSGTMHSVQTGTKMHGVHASVTWHGVKVQPYGGRYR